MLLLLCLILYTVRIDAQRPRYVSDPVDIVDGESLQFDVLRPALENPVTLTRVVACASVDAPYLAYDPDRSSSTGCNSPGYTSMEIYSRDRPVSSKFAARLASGGRTMYLQKRLVNVHTPVVHLQVEGFENVRDLKYPLQWHEHVSYVMERRYVPIGKKPPSQQQQEDKGADKSYWQKFKDTVSSFVYGATEDDEVPREDDDYGREHYTSYVMGHHWFVYSLIALGMFAGVVLFVLIAGYATARALYSYRQWKIARSMSYEERYTREQQQKTRDALAHASNMGMYGSGQHQTKERRYPTAPRDPFGEHDEERTLLETMFDTEL